MGILSKLTGADRRAKEAQIASEPVIGRGRINAITRSKNFGYILEHGGKDSVFFKSDAVADFAALEVGQEVEYTRGVDPGDPMRYRATDVRLI